MTRVSLKEAYDNKDVVAQIYAIRDTAEGASDTADSAKTTADDAKTYVDTLGVQVEGAVQTANNASASAQESAETVSQYDTRLTQVENKATTNASNIATLSTLVDGEFDEVTARITTAEGNIVTIQGRVTALETADGQNVKINRINDYALGLTGSQEFSGIKKATATGFFRKKSSQFDLNNPVISGGSATDETFVLEDKNGSTAVQIFNSYTPEAQTIFQVASKYVFDDNGTVKTTNGMLWLAVYSNRARLYLRYVDKNGTAHIKEIGNVTDTD